MRGFCIRACTSAAAAVLRAKFVPLPEPDESLRTLPCNPQNFPCFFRSRREPVPCFPLPVESAEALPFSPAGKTALPIQSGTGFEREGRLCKSPSLRASSPLRHEREGAPAERRSLSGERSTNLRFLHGDALRGPSLSACAEKAGERRAGERGAFTKPLSLRILSLPRREPARPCVPAKPDRPRRIRRAGGG